MEQVTKQTQREIREKITTRLYGDSPVTDKSEVIFNQIIAPEYYFKDILTIKDASAYTGLSIQSIHQHIHNKKIPCYKPTGVKGNVYFMKSELNDFMLRNKKLADYEVSKAAETILNGGE